MRVTRRQLLLASASTLAIAGSASCSKAPGSCNDTSGLTPDERKTRLTLGYTDKSSDKNKTCENCQQYVAAPSADQCGGCKVMKGPIHPQGYCVVFVAK